MQKQISESPREEVLALLHNANDGNYKEAFHLGNCFAQGLGVRQDWTEAAYWYRRSANTGFPSAMNNLAYLLEEGLGVNCNLTQARSYYEYAAKNGNPAANNNLGVILISTRDKSLQNQAIPLFRFAIEKGCAEARVNFAYCLYHGLGCEKNHTKAFHQIMIALKEGCFHAIVATSFFPEDTGQQVILQQYAAQGDPYACINFGCQLLENIDTLTEEEKVAKEAEACVYFWQAATQEEQDTICHLTHRVYLRESTQPLWLRMLPWFGNSYANCRSAALRNLSKLYRGKNELLGNAFNDWAHRELARAETRAVIPKDLDRKTLNLLGEQLAVQGDWPAALPYFEEAHEYCDPCSELNLYCAWIFGDRSDIDFGWETRLSISKGYPERDVLLGIYFEQRGEWYESRYYYEAAARQGSVAGALLWAWLLPKQDKTLSIQLLESAATWKGPTPTRNAFGTVLPTACDSERQETVVHVAPWFRGMAEDAAELARAVLPTIRNGEMPDKTQQEAIQDFKDHFYRDRHRNRFFLSSYPQSTAHPVLSLEIGDKNVCQF